MGKYAGEKGKVSLQTEDKGDIHLLAAAFHLLSY